MSTTMLMMMKASATVMETPWTMFTVVAGDALEDELAHSLDVEDHLDDDGTSHGVADA